MDCGAGRSFAGCRVMLGFRDIEDLLILKPKGVFHVVTDMGRTTIRVYRRNQPEEVIFCFSPGHANQVRQSLTDAGLFGLVGDAQ